MSEKSHTGLGEHGWTLVASGECHFSAEAASTIDFTSLEGYGPVTLVCVALSRSEKSDE